MSLALYDKAFEQKLKNLTENTSIHVYNVSETKRLFEVIADETNDKPLKLPIICLRRSDGYTINQVGNNARSLNGAILATQQKTKTILNMIPIQISYEIDVYTRKFEEADAIMRELVFTLTNQPLIVITIPYNGVNQDHRSTITLATQVRDNSAVAERLISGQFSRLTLNCSINDAHLFDVRDVTKKHLIVSGLDVVQPDGKTIYHEDLPIPSQEIYIDT